MSPLTVTRERSAIEDCVTVKPFTRITASLRARSLTLLSRLGVLDTSYAMFGIERSPVCLGDIQRALGFRIPTAFVFYWVSYFVDFDLMYELRQAYPHIPFLFVCLDDALLTGGCHYSWGCSGYQYSCDNCPATSLKIIKKRIMRGYCRRKTLVTSINPVVIYPTTNVQQMGERSAVLKHARSMVIPLGAISSSELTSSAGQAPRHAREPKDSLTLLIRSSSEYRKGCDLFVSAIKLVSERVPDLRARLDVISIGDDTLTKAQIDRYVDYTDKGYVNRVELLAAYQQADVLLVSSREDGGPIMTNEGVALGIFVMATPVGVARDLIVHGENGLIMRDVSSEAMADALMDFLLKHAVDSESSSMTASRTQSLTFEGYVQAMLAAVNSAA